MFNGFRPVKVHLKWNELWSLFGKELFNKSHIFPSTSSPILSDQKKLFVEALKLITFAFLKIIMKWNNSFSALQYRYAVKKNSKEKKGNYQSGARYFLI